MKSTPLVLLLFAHAALAQTGVTRRDAGACAVDRLISAGIGVGLGAALGAIPATARNKYHESGGQFLLLTSMAAGGVLGAWWANRDRECAGDSATTTMTTHWRRASTGSMVGAAVGAAAGAIGGSLIPRGCVAVAEGGRSSCDSGSAWLIAFVAGLGAVAFGLLGAMIGWVW